MLIVPTIQKKKAKVYLPLCSNAYDDVKILKLVGFTKAQKPWMYRGRNIKYFLQIKKTHYYIKNYFMAKMHL